MLKDKTAAIKNVPHENTQPISINALLIKVKEYYSLMLALGILFSTTIVLGYSSKNNFVPNISLSDSYFYISVSIASVFVYFVMLAYSVYSTIWLVKLLSCFGKRCSKNKKLVRQLHKYLDDKTHLISSFLVFLFFSLLLITKVANEDTVLWIAGFLVSGFLIVVIFGTVPISESKSDNFDTNVNRFILVLILLFPFLITGASQPFLDAVFRALSVRQENVMLILSEKNYQHLKSVSLAAQVKIKQYQTGSNEVVIDKATLIWHGIGSKSLVLIKDESRKVSVELESNGVFPVNLIDNPMFKNHKAGNGAAILGES